MANEAGLELPIGLTEQKFMQQLARIEAQAFKTAQKMEKDFVRSNSKIAKSTGEVGKQLDSVFSRISRGASSSFAGISRGATAAVAGVVAILAAMNKLGTYAQNYRQVENRLRSLGEYSDEAAEKLTAAALRSRTGLIDMADGVARIQKATGAGYDETIRRVETLNKLLTVGGASGGEVGSVMLQLSQALSSGVLQGDELRSLREAAPVELLDAIAKAAGGTRDQLKQMGEEGRLTSAVVTQALDEMAASADANFSRMAPTMADGWNNINTALTTFIGRADEGLGASDALARGMMDLSDWLSSNADAAENFGISVRAALGTFDEYATKAMSALNELSNFLNTTVQEAIYGPGDAFAATGMTAGDAISSIIDALAIMNGALEGTADAVSEAFLKIPDAITGALQSAMNAVIGAVETMVNTVLEGVRGVALGVDNLMGAIAQIPGAGGVATNLAGGIGNVSLNRVSGVATDYSSRSISEAYNSGYDRGAGTVNAAADAVGGFFEGITESYERRKAELRKEADEADNAPPGVTPPPPPGGSSGGESGGGSRGGRKRSGGGSGRKSAEPANIFESAERDIQNLQRQIELMGKSSEEAAVLQSRWAMMDAAKKAGIPINETLNAQIDAQAGQIGSLTAELERGELAQQQFDQAVDGIANAFSNAILEGENLRDSLAGIFKQIAANILNAGIQNALTSAFSGMAGGGGFFGRLIGAAFGGTKAAVPTYDGGGHTGFGSRAGGIDGKGGFPAILHPNETVIDHTKGVRSNGSNSMSMTIDLRGTTGDKALDAKIAQAGQAILAQVPATMANAQKRRPGAWGN